MLAAPWPEVTSARDIKAYLGACVCVACTLITLSAGIASTVVWVYLNPYPSSLSQAAWGLAGHTPVNPTAYPVMQLASDVRPWLLSLGSHIILQLRQAYLQ